MKAFLDFLSWFASFFGGATTPLPPIPPVVEDPIIRKFKALPSEVVYGETIQLEWDTEHATERVLFVDGERIRDLSREAGRIKVTPEYLPVYLRESIPISLIARNGVKEVYSIIRVVVLPVSKPQDVPSEFVSLADVEPMMRWQTHKWEGLYAYDRTMAWQGTRDYLKVIDIFPKGCEILGSSVEEFRSLSRKGEEVLIDLRRIVRLVWKETDARRELGKPIPNRRGGEFAGVSNLRKDVWLPFKRRLLECVDESSAIRENAGRCRDDSMGPYDSISGWATRMLQAGYTKCPQ